MSRAEFIKFVERQNSAQKQDAAIDYQLELSEWWSALEKLYSLISEFLKIFVKNGMAEINFEEIELNEEFSGPYKVKAMRLRIGKSVITFKPVGTMLIGSKGRVDVSGPRGESRLVLIDKNVTSARQFVRISVKRGGDAPIDFPVENASSPEWVWKLASPGIAMDFMDLTEDNFFDMVLAVADA